MKLRKALCTGMAACLLAAGLFGCGNAPAQSNAQAVASSAPQSGADSSQSTEEQPPEVPSDALTVIITQKKAEQPYQDVAADAYYEPSVWFVWANDFLQGTSETTFAPEKEISRVEFAKALYLLDGTPVKQQRSFSDLEAGSPENEAACWCLENELFSAQNDAFSPQSSVTLLQAFCAFYRSAQANGYDMSCEELELGLEDALEQQAVSYGVQHGLWDGQSGNTHLSSPLTRADAALMLRNYYRNVIYFA